MCMKRPEYYLVCQIFITLIYKARTVQCKAIVTVCFAVCSVIKPNIYFP